MCCYFNNLEIVLCRASYKVFWILRIQLGAVNSILWKNKFLLLKAMLLVTILMLPNKIVFGQAFQEELVEMQLPQGILIKGTITSPTANKPCPVVLIISGSGPTDRNGNNPYGISANYLKMLADNLAQQGIASLRYDKRGIGASACKIKEKNLIFDDYVDDASLWVTKLRQDKRFSSVIVAGHSEGALIGILVAEKQPIDGLISLSGAGESLQKTILRQIAERQPQILAKSTEIVASLERGVMIKVDNPELQFLFRSGVQPFLISEFRYDPSVEIRKLKIPILLIQGSCDLQINELDAKALKAANGKAKLVIIEGMNHMLKNSPPNIKANIATYSNPNIPLAKPLIPAVTNFVKQIDAKKIIFTYKGEII